MGLKSLKLATAKVEVPGGDSFAVRGLSLADIMGLFKRHRTGLEPMFVALTADPKKVNLQNNALIAGALLEAMPEVAAEIIAIAADEHDDEGIAIAGSLPFPVQIDALEKIGGLTFAANGGAKNAVAAIARIAKAMAATVNDLKA